MDVKLAIVGGGIAGLSTALACQTQGIEAHVFERAPEFKPIGTSVSLWPNAMQCLADWGIAADIEKRGARLDTISWRRPDGRAYFAHPLDGLYDEFDQAGYCVRRSDLHSALATALPTDQLHLGAQFTGMRQTDDHVELQFADGRTVKAKNVIAADGIWSSMRGADEPLPKYAGYGAWLGFSYAPTLPFAKGEGCEILGPNGRLGVFETGSDTRYWFFVHNTPDANPQARSADPQELAPYLDPWPDGAKDLILNRATSAVYVSFYDRPLTANWGQGRLTYVGDAMHPFVPNLGQGACQAIEDGYCIANGLAKGLSGEDLNRWMKTHRHARVRYMRQSANRLGRLAQNTSPVARAGLSLVAATMMRPQMSRELRKQFKRSVGA